MDEAYSYGLTNYERLNISDNEDFFNTWHDKNYYLDYLTVNQEEAKDFTPVYENQKNDVHPPFYYLLLRIAMNFSIDHFSKWTGIILNIIISCISSIFVYLIANKLFKNSYMALMVCFVSGLTNVALESTLYIRMYELTTLMILITTYIHILKYEKNDLTIKDLIAIGIPVCIGFLTHYYYLLFLVGMYFLFMYHYGKEKNYKNMIKYTICMLLAGGVGLLIFPYAISHIFFGYRGQGAMNNFFSVETFITNVANYLNIINTQVFNYIGIFIIIFIIYQKTKQNIKLTQNKEFLIMLVPTVTYFLIAAQASPYKDIRYIIPISTIFIILTMYAFYQCFKGKKAIIITACVFAVMLCIPNKLDYAYEDYQDIVTRIDQDTSIPAVYIFNAGQNRFLDDIYLFSKLEKSYIIKPEDASKEKLTELFAGEENIYLFLNEGMNNDEILGRIKGYRIGHIKRMNACDIYLLSQVYE